MARSVARQRRIALSEVRGSGPDGQVMLRDVETPSVPAPRQARVIPAIADTASGAVARAVVARTGQQLAAAKPAVISAQAPCALGAEFPAHERIPLTPMRRVIAARLSESKSSAPHYYMSSDVTLDALVVLRARLNPGLSAAGAKLSMNDLLAKMVASTLARHPALNSAWMHDHIARFEQVNLAVAVAIDGGLVTPVLRDAAGMGLKTLSARLSALVDAARRRALPTEAFAGGTFTLSNLGMYPVKDFQAIINPPQAAILAIAGPRRELLPGDDGSARVEQRTTLTLSVDHRVADGVAGAEFLQDLKRVIEDPRRLLL